MTSSPYRQIILSGLCALILLFTPAKATWGGTESSPSRGVFLVADPKILDPNFKETVVLLLEHGKRGSIGLVINRPTTFSLSKLLPKVDADLLPTGTLHEGGPVDRQTLTLLYRSKSVSDQVTPLFADVYASQEARILAEQLKMAGGKGKFRLYAGYAAWGRVQLRAEMERGDWHVVEADIATLYERPLERVWQDMYNRSQEMRVHRPVDWIDSFL